MDITTLGKVALVTGAAQGIGRAVGVALARSGAAGICVVDRDRKNGEAVTEELKSLGTQARFVLAELAEPLAAREIVHRCIGEFGRVDYLVNAAGRTDRASVASSSVDLWDTLFAVNARAPAFLMQHCIADMLARHASGSIVNILSMNIHCGSRELAIYSASKAALALLTKNAAQAHRFDRIRVNGINVGWTATPAEMKMQSETLGKGGEWLEAAERAQPFGRLIAPEDVAKLTLFLLSEASLPMTGSLIDQEQWVSGHAD
jgi:NAD(P)-dependent dehydrogenase (short-subunit alcohol dehydrogenase family)